MNAQNDFKYGAMHDFQLPTTHARLGRFSEVRSICFKPKPLQIQSEAHVTLGNARMKATKFNSCGHLWFSLHGLQIAW
jgi:hypothetical protein